MSRFFIDRPIVAIVISILTVFLGILVVGYVYLWWRGALEWD